MKIKVIIAYHHPFDLDNYRTREGDSVFCTLDEFQQLTRATGLRRPVTLGALRNGGVGSLFVTLGGGGALAMLGTTRLYFVNANGTTCRSYEVDPASGLVALAEEHLATSFPAGCRRPANSVGAGDVFSGVYTAASLSNYSSESALQAAARAASLSVCHRTWDEWISRVPNLDRLLQI